MTTSPRTDHPTIGPGYTRGQLAAVYAGRFTGNWGLRFVFPFLPTIARGLGIPLETAGLIAGARELTGLTGPLLARWIDRGYRRWGLVLSLIGMSVCLFASGLSPGVALFTIGMLAFGVAKTGYDVSSIAWIGDHTTYERRGAVIGVVETSWAMAFLVGVPVAAWLIDTASWRAPFLFIGILALVLSGVVARTLPPDPAPTGPVTRSGSHLSRAALAFYLMLMLLNLGPQLVFASYGAWLEDSFGFTIAALGVATTALGAIEFVGSSGSALLTDRLGKKNSILAGMCITVPALLLLGPADGNQAVSLILLGLVFLGFEFAIVSSFPLAAELDPEARAAGVGTSFAALTLGRAIGTTLGVWLYVQHGIGATGVVGAVAVVACLTVLVVGVRDPGSRTSSDVSLGA